MAVENASNRLSLLISLSITVTLCTEAQRILCGKSPTVLLL